jgi:hypothetical protein
MQAGRNQVGNHIVFGCDGMKYRGDLVAFFFLSDGPLAEVGGVGRGSCPIKAAALLKQCQGQGIEASGPNYSDPVV